jgi:hypothetical protein
MRVEVSDEAAAFVSGHGGTVWVWARRPAMCCNGTPATMRASVTPPPDLTGFVTASAKGIDVLFRAPGGRFPDVLEVGLHGRRRPRVEGYWDGCLIVM